MHKIVLYIIICTKICICRSQCAHDSKMRCISKSCTRNLQIYYLTPACTLANWKRNSNHSRTAHFSNCTDSQIARNIMHVVIVIHIRVCSGSKSLTQLWSVIRPSEIVLGGMWGLADLKIPMHVHFFRRAIFTHKVRHLVFSVRSPIRFISRSVHAGLEVCVQQLRFVSPGLTFHTHRHTDRRHSSLCE